jgi:hypothetical protein
MLAFMARNEHHREDLNREATALAERIEIAPRDSTQSHIAAGFRTDGSLSVYFGDDPVYQFNSSGELRRAFCNSLLVKAVAGRLATLRRVRQPHETELRRHDLSHAEEAEFLRQLTADMNRFRALLESGDYRVVGQFPQDADIVGRVRQWLKNHRDWHVAKSPRVR